MLSSTGRVPPTSVQAVHTSAGGVPSTLANLPAGTLITGTVTGRDAAGRTLLRTDAGTLALAARLDRGSVVILRIQGGPTFSATIVSVDGRPPATLPLAPPPAAPASPGKPPRLRRPDRRRDQRPPASPRPLGHRCRRPRAAALQGPRQCH